MKKQSYKILSGLKNQSQEYYKEYGFLPNQLAFVFTNYNKNEQFKNLRKENINAGS